jgi:Fe-S-cluster-containing hydrogenase component 2
MNLRNLFNFESIRRQVIIEAVVVPDSSRCVQCGICNYHCPIGINVRMHAWLDDPVKDSHCLTCGECIARCPRGTLRFERSRLFNSVIGDSLVNLEKEGI